MRYSATLACGAELQFEFPEAVPAVGDVMPCRRHRFCVVTDANRTTRGRRPHTPRPYAPRPNRRTALSPERAEKLLAYLDEHPGATRLEIIAGTGLTYAAITRAETEGAVRVEVGHRRTRRYYLPA